MTNWQVEDVSGPAEELFTGDRSSAALIARTDELQPTMRFVTVDAATLVLGSGQSDSIVGSVPRYVRRRSGGGAVWLDPAEQVWADVILPAGHHLWSNDVTQSFEWLGAAWVRAVRSLGVTEPTDVHVGRLEPSPWSGLLCFAGRGPGEVFVRNRKLVGISQRRSRGGALFQCGILTRWRFDPTWFATDSWPVQLNRSATPVFDGLLNLGFNSDVAQAGIGLFDLGVRGQLTQDPTVDSHRQIEAAFIEAVEWVDASRRGAGA